MNLNCKIDLVVSLEIENNKLDLVGKTRSFQPRMFPGRFPLLRVCISSCPYPTDVSNSRTCRVVNRRNADSSVVDRLHQLWVLFFLGLPFCPHVNLTDVAVLMLSISVRLRRDTCQLQIPNIYSPREFLLIGWGWSCTIVTRTIRQRTWARMARIASHRTSPLCWTLAKTSRTVS